MLSRKLREFTADSPLVIQIVLRPTGDWTIQPDPNFHKKMKDRLKDADSIGPGKVLQDRIVKEWTDRKRIKPEPDFLTDPEHIPYHDP